MPRSLPGSSSSVLGGCPSPHYHHRITPTHTSHSLSGGSPRTLRRKAVTVVSVSRHNAIKANDATAKMLQEPSAEPQSSLHPLDWLVESWRSAPLQPHIRQPVPALALRPAVQADRTLSTNLNIPPGHVPRASSYTPGPARLSSQQLGKATHESPSLSLSPRLSLYLFLASCDVVPVRLPPRPALTLSPPPLVKRTRPDMKKN